MAVDQTLIQGAGAVAKARAAKIGAKAEGASGLIDTITSVGQKFLDKRVEASKEYDEKAQAVLDASGELPVEEYDALYDILQENRNSYITGSKKNKAMLTRDLNMKAVDVGDYKEFREELADLKLNDVDGFSKSFLGTPESEAYFALLEDKSRLKPDPNNLESGRLGVMMPGPKGEDVWTDITKLKKTIEDNRVDTDSRDLLQVYANKNMQLSAQVAYGQKLDFPFETTMDQLKTNLIGKSKNFKSLFYDDIIAGQPFAKNFIDELKKGEYSKYGVEFEDKNNDGKIDDADAEKIFEELTTDPSFKDSATDVLANYFTKHLQNNFDAGTAMRNVPDKGYELKTNTQTGRKTYVRTTK
tara:strand:- start:187 stop:1257 length:1071 start_codon:yes stop_codon:yes gene_type:complete